MITQVIGIKQFRENITSLWKKAKKKKIRYIVMHHSTPIMEVNPVFEKELILDKLAEDITEAREQVKRGEIYTQEEVMKEFDLL